MSLVQPAPEPYSAQQPPTRPSRRRLVVLIVVGVVLFLGALGVSLSFLIQALVGSLAPVAPDQPLLTGEPGSPVAVEPLECAGPCFDETWIVPLTIDDGVYVRLGLEQTTFPAGTYEPASVTELLRRDRAAWESYGGDPEACFFSPASAPYGASIDEAPSDDQVWFLGTHEDVELRDSADQSLRIFPDTATATAYLGQLAESVDACEFLSIGPENDRYSATLTPAPAFDLPSDVAAVGWVRTGDAGPRWRAYIVDLQRANAVVRIRVLTDGSITELQFRNTVERYATALAAIPVTSGAPTQ